MPIRSGSEEDFSQLASLFSSFFQNHTMFQRDTDIIIAYIRKESLEHELIVYEENNLIKGAFYLVNTGTNKDGSHKRWKFRHFAFETEPIAQHLLGEAEKKVRENSRTAKVELTIAEDEEGIEFYRRWGYKKEAELLNHYRWGETCFVFGKSFS